LPLFTEELGILGSSPGHRKRYPIRTYDNSMAESFVSTLKRELIHCHSWPNRQTARTAIFEYIEGLYNTRRRHSALGHLSPSEYEEVRLRGDAAVA
jgi:transposase InsO family protein